MKFSAAIDEFVTDWKADGRIRRAACDEARREAFREAVEWWRKEGGNPAAVGRFEYVFLSPDNPEGNA